MKDFHRPGIPLLHFRMTVEFPDDQANLEGIRVQENPYLRISSLRACVLNGEAVLRMTKQIQMCF